MVGWLGFASFKFSRDDILLLIELEADTAADMHVRL